MPRNIIIPIAPESSPEPRDNFSEIQAHIDHTRWRGVGVTDRLPRETRPAHAKTEIIGPDSFMPHSNETKE